MCHAASAAPCRGFLGLACSTAAASPSNLAGLIQYHQVASIICQLTSRCQLLCQSVNCSATSVSRYAGVRQMSGRELKLGTLCFAIACILHCTCRGFFVPGAKGHESWNKVPPALRVLVRAEWLNWAPPNGTGWFSASAPRLGTRRQLVRPPPPVQPQHHMPWHQLPQQMQQQQHVPLHHMQQQMHQQQMQQQQMRQHQMHQQQMHQLQLAWPQQAVGVLPHMPQNLNIAYVPPQMRPGRVASLFAHTLGAE